MLQTDHMDLKEGLMMGTGRTAKRMGSEDSLVQPLRKISPAPALSGEQRTLARLTWLRKVHRCFALVKLLGASPLWFGVIPKPVILAPAHCFRFLSAPPFLLSCTPCWLPTPTDLYNFKCEELLGDAHFPREVPFPGSLGF